MVQSPVSQPRIREYLSMKPVNSVRIIGGTHRGRKIAFADHPGLRPTGDRVRETLFNWLQFELHGRTCLDLFAGSGALGIEALSRGAGNCVFVEKEPQVARQVSENLGQLQLATGSVINSSAEQWLSKGHGQQQYELVFLDPPFKASLVLPMCRQLDDCGLLAPGALLYLEDCNAVEAGQLPEGWRLLKSKKAGDVFYHLATTPQ